MSELRDRELRDLLERVSAIDGDVDVDEHWVAGRRRRTRRGAGVVVVTGVVAIAAVGALAQTGLLGGSGTTPTGPAAVPDSLETFVFAAPGVTAQPQGSAELGPATPDEIAGTSWVLQDGMWNASTAASALTGTTEPTSLTFDDGADGPGGWAIDIDGCGLAAVPDLVLDEQGRFADQSPFTHDLGCAEDVQAAEDFWTESLSGGGQFTLAGDGRWLLLSVEAPAPPTPSPTSGPEPTPAPGPSEDEDATGDEGTAAPGDDGTVAPTGEVTTPPTTDAGPPTADAPSTPTAPPGPPFLDPTQESVDEPWPGGSGELFAPTVRAGVHGGFDRVVVDLEGTGDLGWRAFYTDDPRLDGSGFPSDIAGDSVLELWLTGMAYPEPGSDVYSEGIFGLDTHTLEAVVEVHRTAPYEGMLQVFVGMQGEPRPYRVFLLEDPMRLVVDVQTSP